MTQSKAPVSVEIDNQDSHCVTKIIKSISAGQPTMEPIDCAKTTTATAIEVVEKTIWHDVMNE